MNLRIAEFGVGPLINEPPTDSSPRTVTAVAELSTSSGLYPSPPPRIHRATIALKVLGSTSGCGADDPFPLTIIQSGTKKYIFVIQIT